MLESFLILLIGGIILAKAIPTDRLVDRTVRVAIFAFGVYLGKQALRSNPQVPQAAAILGCVGVSVLCGLAIAELLYGHVVPSASVKIQTVTRINRVLILAMAFRMFFGVCAPLIEVRFPTGNFWQEHSIAMAIRWTIGLIVPMILLCLAQQSLRQKSLRQWRIHLLPAIAALLIGEAIALHLTQLTGLPF